MKPTDHDESQWLAWIEGELDAETLAEVEAQMEEDPVLSERLHAMRRDREALQSIVEPSVPEGMLDAIKVPGAINESPSRVKGRPGRYRQGTHVFDVRVRITSGVRVAALFIIGIGLLASPLLLVIPLLSQGTEDDPRPVAGSSELLEILANQKLSSPVGSETQAGAAGGSTVDLVETEPLALLLPDSDDVIGLLRRLTYRSGGTLVRNASGEDFKDSELSASTGTSVEGEDQDMQPVFLQGKPEWVPAYDQQFEYAQTGATWTIVVPLSRLDAFLGAFDSLQDDQVLLVLLADHLDDVGGEWMRPVAARATVESWPRVPRDVLIHIPIYAGE